MPSRHDASWHRTPIVWIGALVFVASIIGCVLTIVLAMRHADTTLPTGPTVLKVPLAGAPAGERR